VGNGNTIIHTAVVATIAATASGGHFRLLGVVRQRVPCVARLHCQVPPSTGGGSNVAYCYHRRPRPKPQQQQQLLLLLLLLPPPGHFRLSAVSTPVNSVASSHSSWPRLGSLANCSISDGSRNRNRSRACQSACCWGQSLLTSCR
jgi:hypothetical protein